MIKQHYKIIAYMVFFAITLTACSREGSVNENDTESSGKDDNSYYYEEYEDTESILDENNDKIEISMEEEILSTAEYPDYFTSIIRELTVDDNGIGLYSVMDKWWDINLYDPFYTDQYARANGEYVDKVYTCEINGESYSFDLQDELVGTEKWNWWTAGVFFDEKTDMVYICLNNAYSYYEDMVQAPHLFLIEFSTEKPEEYQVWSYEVEPPDLFCAEVRKCYLLGDKIFIAGQTGDASIDLNTKQLRYYTEERLVLEDFVNEKYGEEGYQAVFFRAVYEQDGVTVYSVHVSEAFDVQPVAVVYAAVRDEKAISYMSIDLASQNIDVVLTETESEISETEATWDFSEIHGSEEGFIVSAQDLYNEGGWGWFPCSKSGTYHFQVMGAEEDIYSPSADHIVWKVYLMEEPFIDTPRFIPQAGYEAVVIGDGSVEIEEGTYIVIYCSQNSYEYGLSSSYEGDSEAFYQCTME